MTSIAPFVALAGALAIEAAVAPPKPCALLTKEEVQTLAPKAIVGAGTAKSTAATGTASCAYRLSGGKSGAGLGFTISVTPGSKAFPGMNATLIAQGLLAPTRSPTGGAHAIDGIGDAAFVQSDSASRALARAYVKTVLLELVLAGPAAEAKKTALVDLLKRAAGRL